MKTWCHRINQNNLLFIFPSVVTTFHSWIVVMMWFSCRKLYDNVKCRQKHFSRKGRKGGRKEIIKTRDKNRCLKLKLDFILNESSLISSSPPSVTYFHLKVWFDAVAATKLYFVEKKVNKSTQQKCVLKIRKTWAYPNHIFLGWFSNADVPRTVIPPDIFAYIIRRRGQRTFRP